MELLEGQSYQPGVLQLRRNIQMMADLLPENDDYFPNNDYHHVVNNANWSDEDLFSSLITSGLPDEFYNDALFSEDRFSAAIQVCNPLFNHHLSFVNLGRARRFFFGPETLETLAARIIHEDYNKDWAEKLQDSPHLVRIINDL